MKRKMDDKVSNRKESGPNPSRFHNRISGACPEARTKAEAKHHQNGTQSAHNRDDSQGIFSSAQGTENQSTTAKNEEQQKRFSDQARTRSCAPHKIIHLRRRHLPAGDRKQSVKNRERRRRIARNFKIDGQDRRDTSRRHRALAEYATADRACADSQDPFGIRHCLIGFQQRHTHVFADRAHN